MIKRKRIVFLLLLFVLTGILFGCQEEGKNPEAGGTKEQISPQGTADPQTATPTEEAEYNGTVLVWAIPDYIEIAPKQEKMLNQLLDEEGCDYHVDFITISGSFSEYEQTLRQTEDVDIACSGFPGTGEITSEFVKSGFFEPLDEWLTDSELYAHYSQKLWDKVRVNGTIYTVPNTGGFTSDINIVFNKKYFSEEEAESFELSLAGLEEALKTVPQEEGISPLVIYGNLSSLWPLTGGRFDNGLIYSEQGGIVSLTASKELRELFDAFHSFYEAGYINYSVGSGTSVYYDKESEELQKAYKQIKGTSKRQLISEKQYGILISSDEEVTNAAENLIVKTVPSVLSGNTNGSTGIAAASEHKKEAFDLLSRFYTDSRMQKILILPDQEVTEENALELYYKNIIKTSLFGTRDLFFDYQERNSHYDSEVSESVYCGFYPDYGVATEVLQQINEIVEIYDDIWMLPDYAARYEEMNAKLTALGMEEIAENVSDQYEAWKNRR